MAEELRRPARPEGPAGRRGFGSKISSVIRHTAPVRRVGAALGRCRSAQLLPFAWLAGGRTRVGAGGRMARVG